MQIYTTVNSLSKHLPESENQCRLKLFGKFCQIEKKYIFVAV